MQQILLKAWQKKAVWLWLLLPLAALYRVVFFINKISYRWGIKKSYYSKVPVIVIGNITVGGSGKTPLIIAMVTYLQQKGIEVAVISRGYGGNETTMPCLVTAQSLPEQVGDEPCLIVQATQVPLAVCPNRGQAIDLLLHQYPKTQLILSDDGLQHFALDRDENWVVVDADRGMGNQQVLPVGFLREPIHRLFEAHTTVIFHQADWQQPVMVDLKNSLSKEKDFTPLTLMRLVEQPLVPLFFSGNEPTTRLLPYQNPTVTALTGIGYPQRFFNSLTKLGFQLIERPLDDHHAFSFADFTMLPDLPIVVTAKDAVKLRILFAAPQTPQQQALAAKIWVMPVVAQLSAEVYQVLDRQVQQLLGSYKP